jgi:hypothetical protein
MYCGQASLLSISKESKDRKLHKQATDNGIDKPELIFISSSLNYFIVIHIKHGVQITNSVDISPVSKGPFN